MKVIENIDRLDSAPAQGFELKLTNEQTTYQHKIGGQHQLPSANCPNCKKPLLQLARIDLRDPKINLIQLKVEQVCLLTCWTCSISSNLSYKLPDYELIEYGRQKHDVDFPYPNYPAAFPEQAAILIPLSTYVQDKKRKLNRIAEGGNLIEEPMLIHQIGGEPFLWQGIRTIECSSCKNPMKFFAAICDNNGTRRGFVGNNSVQMLYFICLECKIVSATNECD